MTTLIYLPFLALIVLGPVVMWAILLRVGLRWAGISDRTWRKVALVTGLQLAMQLFAGVFFMLLRTFTAEWLMLAVLAIAIAATVAICWVISRVFKTSAGRAFQIWLPTQLSWALPALLAYFVIRPYVVEAFKIPSNNMAPTIVGRHRLGTCSECGQLAFAPAVSKEGYLEDPLPMICQQNFHVTYPDNLASEEIDGDRILAAKFVRPQRWDLIVFRKPDNPETQYVMRLVGLPNEEIIIRGGDVYADGQLIAKPEGLRGIKYDAEDPHVYRGQWGGQKRPAKLGKDEFFVLGDFHARSFDSRYWDEGAPGHQPFAVPQSYVQAVVTHTYWPPSRWRIFR